MDVTNEFCVIPLQGQAVNTRSCHSNNDNTSTYYTGSLCKTNKQTVGGTLALMTADLLLNMDVPEAKVN